MLFIGIGCTQNPDTEPIRTLINATFDRPDSKVKVFPIVAVENFAIADWQQDAKAGRALAEFKNGKWQLVLCGGKALKDTSTLTGYGIPTQTANELIEALKTAEAELTKEQVENFDKFSPLINFSDSSSHHKGHH